MMTALVGGTVQTITHGILEEGTVLAENGKILAVGKNLDIPSEAQVIHTHGCWVMPGLIDCHTHLCLIDRKSVV